MENKSTIAIWTVWQAKNSVNLSFMSKIAYLKALKQESLPNPQICVYMTHSHLKSIDAN